MIRLLNISEASNIAIHSLAFLAHKNVDGVCSVSEISSQLNVSAAHLHKVLQKLVRTEIINSSRGAHGGYSLLKKPSEISLFDILDTIDGPFHKTDCLLKRSICEEGTCALNKLSLQVANFLKSKSIADIKMKKSALTK